MVWNVMLVDDEQIMHRYISQMSLWRGGVYRLVGQAYSADEALAFLSRNCVDVLLMDVSMPSKDGVALSAILGAQYPDMIILAVSNYDQYDYVRQIMKNGATDYLLKSGLDEAALLSALDHAVRREDGEAQRPDHAVLRRRVRRWLDTGEACPFTIDGSRMGVCYVRVPGLGHMPDAVQTTILEGLPLLLEAESTPETDQTAVFLSNDAFAVFLRFYGETSQARLQAYMERQKASWIARVEQAYHLAVDVRLCPMMRSNDMLLTYVRHIAESRAPESTEEKDGLTLSEQKHLLELIDRRSGREAAEYVASLLGALPPQSIRGRMMMIRELMELLCHASLEWQMTCSLPTTGPQLYQWIQQQPDPAGRVAALYAQVLDEARDKSEAGYSDVVRRAIRVMEESCTKPVSVSLLASRVHVNSSYLSRVFHRETGKTPVEYMTQLKIDQGKKALEKGVSIKEAALAAGFTQYTYFLKVFRAVTGMTPAQYQQKVKNGQQ